MSQGLEFSPRVPATLRPIASWVEAEEREMQEDLALSPGQRIQIALALLERAYGPIAAWPPIRSAGPAPRVRWEEPAE